MRDAQTTIVVGKNGTGKSTLILKVIKKMKRRAVVITYDGMPKIWRSTPIIDPSRRENWEWKSGIRQIRFAQHDDETYKYILKYGRDLIVLFDDCKEYIPNNIDGKIFLKRILSQFRHRMFDLFFIAHAPDDVPKRIWIYYSHVFIFATDVLFDKRRINIGSAEKILKAQHRVNRQFAKAKQKGNNSHYGIFEIVSP